MAVGENVSVDLGNFRAESSVSSSSNDQDHHIHNNNVLIQPLYMKVSQVGHHQAPPYNHHQQQRSNGGESYKREIRELQELFSKLNPMAAEFVPPSLSNNNNFGTVNGLNGVNGGFYGNSSSSSNNNLVVNGNGFDRNGQVNGNAARRKKNYGQVKRRISSRTSMAQREDTVRRTVYVSDIDQQVTEEQLAALFINCGQVVDCRICGDPNSVLHFAFIEFTDEEGARAALSLSGTMLGYYPVKVLPSKTAIAPVNHTFLPRNDDEREMCARTIYCTNIDRNFTQSDIKLFFESLCGEVYRLRLLGDHHHPTRIAFVEFVMAGLGVLMWLVSGFSCGYSVCSVCGGVKGFLVAMAGLTVGCLVNRLMVDCFLAESAIAALNCSGAVIGSLPIRVSPSKTPVRPRGPRVSVV
ncbi:polyadenylate-binding protein-interacting protein 11-like [Populus alba x Populus x berolinensis]|uniref:Polyadenylate-binding protein-interacting protein 11-like n=1 Tax=Populus alba x Populus x berolinensis TaxID=444605 RepID=A0AAD6RUD3_9ROSI|nr:polyadenylate-binding protein-interacting protein 11-like [Populus alba x Populus x berolinensis]KAJ7015123.1 polyadenylate-binding protein-interacting protein 11-like [Populus alba x Populus x berolinensis]